jgi:small GTP-binding protein
VSESWQAIQTPMQRPGAIACIMLAHHDPATIGINHPGTNQLALTDILGLDEGVVLGIDASTLLLMPHGGIAIVRSISSRLRELGVPMRQSPDPVVVYPEARSEIEAWCMHTLSVAPSPLAVDLLLKHNERWHAMGVETIAHAARLDAIDQASPLDRFVHPPTVAAVGRSNVGKSSLINALVGQQVALVADVPGTTRDHVGVPVELGGLVVRWVDTPGVDERIDDSGEVAIARSVLANADLVVHCIDSLGDEGELDPRLEACISVSTPRLRLGTRSDLGEHACPCDLRVSVGPRAAGITDLVGRVRSILVPEGAMDDPRPWRFWASLGADA